MAKVHSVAAAFRADWDKAIGGLEGVSAGVVRSLRAYAEVDVEETLATIASAGDLGPGRGAGLLLTWRRWHPAYVVAEIARQLPELVERWPTRAVRREREIARQKRVHWADDAQRTVEAMGCGSWPKSVLCAQMNMRPGRFERLIDALIQVGAVKTWGDRAPSVLAVASPQWAREKILALVG